MKYKKTLAQPTKEVVRCEKGKPGAFPPQIKRKLIKFLVNKPWI